MTTDISLIGAHASALMKLRATSLKAYGIDPHSLAIEEYSASETRSLAKIKKEERSLAIQTDHSLVAL